MTEQERPISDTRFKLEEASYFFEQRKNNLDNRKHFVFNLVAFVVAGRSVTFVMQYEFTRKGGPFGKWYSKNVNETLRNEDVPRFFHNLRNIVLKKVGNPEQYLRMIVTKEIGFRFHVLGAATENDKEEEEGFLELNSERESQQEQETTIIDNPAPPDPTLKYVWDIPEINDKTKKSKRYVIESCEQYLKRLSGLVDECERSFT